MHFKAKQWEYLQGCWHLTPREVEVAKLVCEGCDNEQIAEELHIAYNTVRVHIGHMCNKVGVRGRVGLIIEFADVLQRARIR
jgi:DNA-binding CsgD family transcriptional regulator